MSNDETPNRVSAPVQLRPKMLSDFIGQGALRHRLGISIRSALARRSVVPHTLFYGGPGLGKTTLAEIVAHEMGGAFKAVIASSIQQPSELLYVLIALKEGDVLFLDELHALDRKVATTLYDAMENNRVSVVIDGGINARPHTFEIPPFTLIGATTHPGMLEKPFRERFVDLTLSRYDVEELSLIVARSSDLLGMVLDCDACHDVARRSRGTPRIANKFVREIRDFRAAGEFTSDTISSRQLAPFFQLIDIDPQGLDAKSRRYLRILRDRFAMAPAGLNSIATAMDETEGFVATEIEPWLIQEGYINRTRLGRVITELGVNALDTHHTTSTPGLKE